MTVTPVAAARALHNAHRRIALTIVALAIAVFAAAVAPGTPIASAQPAGLTAEELLQGGYVIFFRHVLADDGVDMAPVNVNDCGTQRNIREAGLRDARTIGNTFRALAIPVSAVYTSEICRAKETAGIAFGRVDAVVPALNLCCIDDQPLTAEQRNAYIEQSVTLIPPRGTNTVIVAHGVGIVADLAQGEAAIYQPDGRGGTVRVARVMPDEWTSGAYRPGGARTGSQP
ncbi:MAG: histidine phosphatase family protein [Dehalococcoidia bacterium]